MEKRKHYTELPYPYCSTLQHVFHIGFAIKSGKEKCQQIVPKVRETFPPCHEFKDKIKILVLYSTACKKCNCPVGTTGLNTIIA